MTDTEHQQTYKVCVQPYAPIEDKGHRMTDWIFSIYSVYSVSYSSYSVNLLQW
jgi:hypothetical protein